MSVTRGYVGHELFCSIFCFPSPFRLVRAIIEVFNEEHNVKIFSLLEGSIYARGLVGEVNLNGMCAVLVLLAYFGKSSQHTHSQLGGSQLGDYISARIQHMCPQTALCMLYMSSHTIHVSSYD